MLILRSRNRHPFFPYHREEEWAGGVHYCYVWHAPFTIIALKDVDCFLEEGVVGDGTHCVVGNSGGYGAAHPGRVGEERVETSVTAVVEVNIDSAVVGEDEIADGVCALNWIGVVIEGLDEPGIFFQYESARFFVCP